MYNLIFLYVLQIEKKNPIYTIVWRFLTHNLPQGKEVFMWFDIYLIGTISYFKFEYFQQVRRNLIKFGNRFLLTGGF